MRISPEMLTRLLLYSFIFGAFLAVLDGVLRALFVFADGKIPSKISNTEESHQIERNMKILKGVYTFLVDFSVVVLGGIGVILLCYYFNDGEFRGFCLFGVALGFILAHISIGRMIKCLFYRLFLVLRRLIARCFSLFIYPFAKFLIFCKKMFKKIANKICNTLAKKRKVVYNKDEELFIYSLAQNGFLNFGEFELVNIALKSSEEQKNGQKNKDK